MKNNKPKTNSRWRERKEKDHQEKKLSNPNEKKHPLTILTSISMKRPLHLSPLGGTNGGDSSLEGNLCTYNLLKNQCTIYCWWEETKINHHSSV
jgi:hypothetical protein